MMYNHLKNSIYRAMVEANRKALQVAPVEAIAGERVRKAWDQRDQSIVEFPFNEKAIDGEITISIKFKNASQRSSDKIIPQTPKKVFRDEGTFIDLTI